MNKPALTIEKQIELLKERGMQFRDEVVASEVLQRVSYYRLKGYWWNLQNDKAQRVFGTEVYFEDVFMRYEFDNKLRHILFEAIEIIEVGLRTQLVYQMLISYGGLWYKNANLFNDLEIFNDLNEKLEYTYKKSNEIFIHHHRQNHSGEIPDAWLILEIISFGTLSKLYNNLAFDLREKSGIIKQFGINSTKVFGSWLESVTLIRNIIAHHSRLFDRTLPKAPVKKIKIPANKKWLNSFSDPKTKYICDNILHSLSLWFYFFGQWN